MNTIRELLLQSPEDHLDAAARASIATWNEPPRAVEIFRTLDECVHGALASGMVIQVLEVLLESAMKDELLTRLQLEEQAVWRHKKTH